MGSAYNETLDPDAQITVEEEIASVISEYQDLLALVPAARLMDDDLVYLGRAILRVVLQRFRPDLFEAEAAAVLVRSGTPQGGPTRQDT